MTTAEQKELSQLNRELERIRREFLSISDRARAATNMAPIRALDYELDLLDTERRGLGSRYRHVRYRLAQLSAA